MGRVNGAAFPLIQHEKEAMELEAMGLIERVPKGADAPGWRLTKSAKASNKPPKPTKKV